MNVLVSDNLTITLFLYMLQIKQYIYIIEKLKKKQQYMIYEYVHRRRTNSVFVAFDKKIFELLPWL